jgi:hypothetical protein
MSTDLEHQLRAARDELPEPDPAVGQRALSATLAVVGRPETRPARRWRLRLVLAAVVLAVAAAAFAVGMWAAPGTKSASASAKAAGPGFLPATGWNTYQTGITSPPQAPSALAANVNLQGGTSPASFPRAALENLADDGVVVFATFYPAGEQANVDAQFPARSLPLSLDRAQQMRTEGQPDGVVAYRLLASVNGYDIDVTTYFGSEPSPQLRAQAQAELGRLVVPAREGD